MGIALPLAAQTTAPSTQPASATWTGAVTGTNVYVRDGPGPQAYPCTRLSAPERIVVVGKTDGWLRILAPKGCYSVISKDYVQVDATGQTGTVTGDNVWVRAGGDLHEANFIGVQRQLGRGDTVAIIGETGEYYKITPPEGAYFYIAESYVRPVEGGVAPTSGAAGMRTLVTEHPELEIVARRPSTVQHPQPSREAGRLQDGREGPGRGVCQTPGAARP